jgi:RecA/RadA recombinase
MAKKKGTEENDQRKADKKAKAKKAAGLFSKLGEIMKNPLAAPASAEHHSGLTNGFIDTGCYLLNALISGSMHGGFPGNHITALAGAPSTGKTYFALTAVKRFLDKNPEGYVLYVETEGAVYKEMLEEWDIDTERCIIVPLNTVEELKHQLSNFIAAYRKEDNAVPCFVVLDSAGMLSTTKEVTDALEGKQARDMTRAQLLRGAMRILTYPLRQAQVPFLFTNHTYDVPGAYVPTKNMAGGDGLVYAASVVIELDNRRLKEGHKDVATKEFTAKDAVGGAAEKKAKDVVANIVKVKLKKGRFTRDGKEIEVYLDHRRGLLPYFGLVEFGLKHGILKKEGNYVHFPTGAKGFVSAINTKPEDYFTDEVMAKLEEACIAEFTFKGRLSRPDEVEIEAVTGEEEEQPENE